MYIIFRADTPTTRTKVTDVPTLDAARSHLAATPGIIHWELDEPHNAADCFCEDGHVYSVEPANPGG